MQKTGNIDAFVKCYLSRSDQQQNSMLLHLLMQAVERKDGAWDDTDQHMCSLYAQVYVPWHLKCSSSPAAIEVSNSTMRIGASSVTCQVEPALNQVVIQQSRARFGFPSCLAASPQSQRLTIRIGPNYALVNLHLSVTNANNFLHLSSADVDSLSGPARDVSRSGSPGLPV